MNSSIEPNVRTFERATYKVLISKAAKYVSEFKLGN